MSTSLDEELESASLALEYALGTPGQTAPTNSKPSLSTSPYAARTIAAAGSAVRAVSLTVPTTSSERSRLVAAARLHAQKRTSQLQKAADNAAESLAKPIKVPTILSTMNVPRTAQPLPLPAAEPLQFKAAPLQTKGGANLSNQVKGNSFSTTTSEGSVDWIALATEKKLRELTKAQEKQAMILREIQEGQINLKEQLRKEAEATAASNTALLRDQQQAHVAALKSTLKDAALVATKSAAAIGKTTEKPRVSSIDSAPSVLPPSLPQGMPSESSSVHHRNTHANNTAAAARVISVPISLTRVPPPASSPVSEKKRRSKEMETVVVPIMVTPIVHGRTGHPTQPEAPESLPMSNVTISENTSMNSSSPPVLAPQTIYQSSATSPISEKEKTLASLLQLMWEDVITALSANHQNKSAHLSDNMILATLSTALMRSEQEAGRAYAQSLRDTVTSMHTEVSSFSSELQALRSTTQTFAKKEADIADKARLAQVATEDIRRSIAITQADITTRVADVERRLTASVSGVQAQVAATASTLSDAVAAAQKSIDGNNPLSAINEASNKIAVRQVLEAEVYEPMRMLAVDVASLKDKVVTQEKLFQSEVKALATSMSSSLLPSTSQTVSPNSLQSDELKMPHEVMEKISDLSSTVARLQAELVDLQTKRESNASNRTTDANTFKLSSDDNDDNNDDDDELDEEAETGEARLGKFVDKSGPYIAIRRGSSIQDVCVKFDSAALHDLSLGEVILSDDFESGDQVQLLPLVNAAAASLSNENK